MKIKVLPGGKDRQLDEAWEAIERFAITGDLSYIEKIYEIDARIAPRGALKAVPTGGEREEPSPVSPEAPHRTI